MGIELIAGFVAAVACAGIALLVQKLSGGRLPRWIVPAAAGAGMIGFAIWSEYDWYPRQSAELPEGVRVIWQDRTPNPLRPWTFVVPLTTSFTAMDTRKLAPHPENAALVLAPIYGFARWQGVKDGFLVVDCNGGRSVPLTEGLTIAPDGTLTGGEWKDLTEEDGIRDAACNAG